MASPLASDTDCVRVRASGKINLALRVGAPEPDGYHPLATVFQAVSLFDEVTVRADDPGRFSVTIAGDQAPLVPADDGNLAVRAARLLDPSGKRNVRSIDYLMTPEGPIPLQHRPTQIDYAHYIEKQIKPIADGVLPFLNTSFDEIIEGRQLELF